MKIIKKLFVMFLFVLVLFASMFAFSGTKVSAVDPVDEDSSSESNPFEFSDTDSSEIPALDIGNHDQNQEESSGSVKVGKVRFSLERI